MLSNLRNNRIVYHFIIIFFLIPSFFGFDYYRREKIKSQLYEVKIDFQDVCKQEFIYEKIQGIKNKIPYEKLGSKYIEEYDSVWPIFRWRCLYRLKTKEADLFQNTKDTPKIGMDLDRYCKEKYPGDKEKASYHDYKDKDSLYCTRPHI